MYEHGQWRWNKTVKDSDVFMTVLDRRKGSMMVRYDRQRSSRVKSVLDRLWRSVTVRYDRQRPSRVKTILDSLWWSSTVRYDRQRLSRVMTVLDCLRLSLTVRYDSRRQSCVWRSWTVFDGTRSAGRSKTVFTSSTLFQRRKQTYLNF